MIFLPPFGQQSCDRPVVVCDCELHLNAVPGLSGRGDGNGQASEVVLQLNVVSPALNEDGRHLGPALASPRRHRRLLGGRG